MLAATSAAAGGQRPLPVTQEYLVRRGDQVTVTLPDGTTTMPGIVTTISSVASAGAIGGAEAVSGRPRPDRAGGAGGQASVTRSS